MRLRLDRHPSPVSDILLVTDETGTLRALDFDDHEPRMRRLLSDHYRHAVLEAGAAPAALKKALDAFFAGNLDALDDIPTATAGTTFQREVWAGLRTIPPATTLSYGQLAARVGRPGSSRAVGAANGSNPIAIVVPCHRVIGANGTLTGYGGGIERKRWLLDHEARHAAAVLFEAEESA